MELRVAVAEQLAWGCARALVFRERLNAINNDRAIALCPLHSAPFAARQVMRHFADPIRLNVEVLQVVHYNVRCRTLAQDTAIAEASRVRRERG